MMIHWQHHNLGADVGAAVEVDHILVQQADAATRHMRANARRFVGAVNAVHCAAQIHRARAKRIAWAAGHEAREIGLALQHIRRRQPIRPFRLALYGLDARPGKAVAADADAVADRLTATEHKIKIGVRGIDDDGAGRFRGRVIDLLAVQTGRNVGRDLGRNRRILIRVRRPERLLQPCAPKSWPELAPVRAVVDSAAPTSSSAIPAQRTRQPVRLLSISASPSCAFLVVRRLRWLGYAAPLHVG